MGGLGQRCACIRAIEGRYIDVSYKTSVREGKCDHISKHGICDAGLVNQGANLRFPAHFRWGEHNVSPYPASKIPHLHISNITLETKASTAFGLSRQNSDEVSNVLFMTAPAAPLHIMSY